MNDLQIAAKIEKRKISEIVDSLNIDEKNVEYYGKYKAKIDYHLTKENPNSKLILVSAINPTPAGEGKTTITIGLSDSLNKIGKKAIVCLRQPSLGPVFGIKGGATGGGYAQVSPMEDINLHFTGDFHAIGAANNLLCALLDNHIYQGNTLNIDINRVVIKRCVDMNDRQLRKIIDGVGGKTNGVERNDGFEITVASEVMAILCLSKDLSDLKRRLGNIIVAYSYDNKPVRASDLNANGAMAVLLKDAINPNLVSTLEYNPALIHGGPFANIAHGCNSIIATKLGMSLADYTITEAGFGADLGAEKFLDIKCRKANIKPSCVVLVATLRALKYNGGLEKDNLKEKNVDALRRGLPNLIRHINNIKNVYHLPVCVALNHFETDDNEEIEIVKKECEKLGVKAILTDVHALGSEGGIELANEVVNLCKEDNNFTYAYDLNLSIEEKIKAIVTKIYHGASVQYSPEALKQLELIKELGYENLPICIAKTPYSFSDDAKKLGSPSDFTLTVKNLKIAAGAEFIVVYAGNVLTLPGLPKTPAADKIDIDEKGNIVGLF